NEGAVVPVDHRVDDCDTGAAEAREESAEQHLTDAASLIVGVNAEHFEPAGQCGRKLPAAHIAEHEADDVIAMFSDKACVGRTFDVGVALRLEVGGVRPAHDLLVEAQHLVYVAHGHLAHYDLFHTSDPVRPMRASAAQETHADLAHEVRFERAADDVAIGVV